MRHVALGLIVALAVAGCADLAAPPSRPSPGPPPRLAEAGSVLVELRGTADLENGTLTFEPAIAARVVAAPPGLGTRIYGQQNVNVRLYSSRVVVDSLTIPKTFTADIGLQNLLADPIGDEQRAAAPPDTLGIYVFFTREPAVTWPLPCVGCFVRIGSYQGTRRFTADGQKYFHWPERVGPAGALTGDTTRERRRWVFEASPEVRGFSFTVLVSAALPPPSESRWAVRYDGDSLPDVHEEPRWRAMPTGGSTRWRASGGALTIWGNPSHGVTFYRRDSIPTGGDAYMDARVRFAGGGKATGIGGRKGAEALLVLDDGVKHVALGVTDGLVGLTTRGGAFIAGGTSAMPTNDGYHTYQLRKYASDSAVFYVDGLRRGALGYVRLDASANRSLAPLAMFGLRPVHGTASAEWDHVAYEIGAARPD